MATRGNTNSIERGTRVRVSGEAYGSYDGEVGRVVGDIAPCKGKPAYAVDMGDVVIGALEEDLTVVEAKGAKRITRITRTKRGGGEA